MKNARHAQILRLIDQYLIGTQEELAEKLQECGFSVTQATVSRDIRQLELRKMQLPDGTLYYTAADGSGEKDSPFTRYKSVLRAAFVSMDLSFNILVIHTVSGMAMAAAAALDSYDWPELLGCIAGDDTIFAVIRDPAEGETLTGRIREIVNSRTSP